MKRERSVRERGKGPKLSIGTLNFFKSFQRTLRKHSHTNSILKLFLNYMCVREREEGPRSGQDRSVRASGTNPKRAEREGERFCFNAKMN